MIIEELIEKFKMKHGDRYVYGNSIDEKYKIYIYCKEHEWFKQGIYKHLNGRGCPKCNGGVKGSKDEFIIKANKKHNNKFDYSLVIYVNCKTKIDILCKEHGIFKQTPNDHLSGNGCYLCANNTRLTNEQFIAKANIIHDNKFDYSNVIYVNNSTNIDIICKEHGIFKQIPYNHLMGNGCKKCITLHKSQGEKAVINYLESNNIEYIHQKTFDECVYINKLKFDFYIEKLNLCIEFNGKQHYQSITRFGGEEAFKTQVIRDNIKKKFCEDNSINLLIIRYDEDILEKLNESIIFQMI